MDPWATVGVALIIAREQSMAEPQYTVRAVKFHCVDESGPDWSGSDEPVWIFTANAGGTVKTTRSQEFGNVDSGDTRSFNMANNNIVWPPDGSARGAPGPIGLAVQIWEMDQGNADKIADATQDAFDVAAWVPVVGTWVSKVPSAVPDLIGSVIGNDLIESKSFEYSTRRLRLKLSTVGSKFSETIRFTGSGGWSGNPPDYDLYLEVKRVS